MGWCDEGAERGEAAVEGVWKVGEDQADRVMPGALLDLAHGCLFYLAAGASERRSPAEPSGKSMRFRCAFGGGKKPTAMPKRFDGGHHLNHPAH